MAIEEPWQGLGILPMEHTKPLAGCENGHIGVKNMLSHGNCITSGWENGSHLGAKKIIISSRKQFSLAKKYINPLVFILSDEKNTSKNSAFKNGPQNLLFLILSLWVLLLLLRGHPEASSCTPPSRSQIPPGRALIASAMAIRVWPLPSGCCSC